MARRGVAGIFGEAVVDVDRDPQNCAWTVRAPDGRVLMQVPWRWAYDQTDLGKRVYHRRDFLSRDDYVAHSSRWEAFEVCMCAYPLTAEDRRSLEGRFPGVTTRQQYVVVDPIWSLEPVTRPVSRSSRPNRTSAPTLTPENVLSPPRQEQPTEQPETAHEAGERKLLL